MRSIALISLAVALVAFSGCSESPSEVAATPEQVFDHPFDATESPDGGMCPDVFWNSEELLDNSVTLTWTSAFGGFDYGVGTPYPNPVISWAVDMGSATFVSFDERPGRNSWTPQARGPNQEPVDGQLIEATPDTDELSLSLSMDPMHRGDEDEDGDGVFEWQGLIGNGHFWLVLNVDDGSGNVERVKLGVNVHLEDPDDGFDDRCPTG